MGEVLKLHKYQQYCVDEVISKNAVGLFLDMGLGKTIITLRAIKTLKYEMFAVSKVLIIAPLKVAESTWSTEASKWDDTSDLSISLVLGSRAEREEALHRDADIYIINRENTQWLVDYTGARWPFDMVVIDESSSFKNHQAKRFKSLRAVRPKINRIVLLTGTPNPRSLMDLWAQVYLLDMGQRLGRYITAYRNAYFAPDKRNRSIVYSYAPLPFAEEAIYKRISDICISMKSEDYLELPEIIYDDIPVHLDKASAVRYRTLERDAILRLPEGTVTAMNSASLTNKLLQLCNGAVYDEDGNVSEIHDCKIEALLETVEQLNGQHALICYNFKHDKTRLLEALKGYTSTVRVYEGAKDERDWNDGKIDLLLVQPASVGYGINLQRGGHHIIWFGLNWSLELYQQTNKRLHRQGQRYPVVVHHLITERGVDEDVIKALHRKEHVQDALLDALKAKVERVKEAL